MKMLAVLAAAVTISLTCAGTASAGAYEPYDSPVTETRTGTPHPALCAVVQLITWGWDLPHWCRSRSWFEAQ